MINLIAMDVYDGTPTIVTVWLTIVVKLTIFIFLQGLIEFTTPETFSFFPAVTSELLRPSEAVALAVENFKRFEGFDQARSVKNLLLISSLLSLLVGTIGGLSQIKIKRLLAFSSISHVGFLLLALGIYTQNSVDSFIFYLVQYSITSLNIFLILLALGYVTTWAGPRLNHYSYSRVPQSLCGGVASQHKLVIAAPLHTQGPLSPWGDGGRETEEINYIIELKGQLYKNPVLSVSFAICLFSMAGIPPLIGFFSKQFVLFSSIENGNHFLSIIAILVSVISASYYLRLIKITFFDSPSLALQHSIPLGVAEHEARVINNPVIYKDKLHLISLDSANEGKINLHFINNQGRALLSNFHSYIVAILTSLILLFFLDPSILLNGTQLISLTIFNL